MVNQPFFIEKGRSCFLPKEFSDMRFMPSAVPVHSEISESSWMFVFSGSRLLIQIQEEKIFIPRLSVIPDLKAADGVHLGALDGTSCYAFDMPKNDYDMKGMMFSGLRSLHGRLDDAFFRIAGYGLQTLRWHNAHQYCGHCGNRMQDKTDERAKVCRQCNAVYFPRISPAVIVAVLKNDRILLAHATRFAGSPIYSVIAGYVEVGETLEQAVEREVFEEVNIKVDRIRYFGSQPWHYSGSLMIAFTAEYAGGTLKPDMDEIDDAGWFSADALPEIPGWGSISRRLIDWFVALRGSCQ